MTAKTDPFTQLRFVTGDLIEMAQQGEIDVLVHGCNCMCMMGGGIAGQLARLYPGVAAVDQAFDKSYPGEKKLGRYSAYRTDEDFLVVNAYTQVYTSRRGEDVFEYEAFDKVLDKLYEDIYLVDRKTRFGFPYIGAGLAHGNWARIQQQISRLGWKGMDITIVEWGGKDRTNK